MTDSAGTLSARYDAKMYEVRALRFARRRLGRPLEVNVRLPVHGVPYAQRPELDGAFSEGARRHLVEVKAHALDGDAVARQETRARDLGFDALVLIAPGFRQPARASSTTALWAFEPDLEPLERAYARPLSIPSAVVRWWRPGGVHFRFTLARRGGATSARRTLNQVDKGIRTREALRREIARLAPRHVPAFVMWSPTRLLFPKDAFDRRRPKHVRERPLVFDVDGHAIHRAFFPCVLGDDGLCADCIGFARVHARRIVACLSAHGLSPVVFFSGRSGFHVYAFARIEDERRAAILRDLSLARVIHDGVIAHTRVPIINLPGSRHGGTGLELARVESLERFRPSPAETAC